MLCSVVMRSLCDGPGICGGGFLPPKVPSKPIQLVVPYGGGRLTDIAAA
jgi:hypothetical protein